MLERFQDPNRWEGGAGLGFLKSENYLTCILIKQLNINY